MSEYVYGLVCPIDETVKYVGKSKNPKKRYQQHLKKLDKQMTPKRKWLENLASKNLSPRLLILSEIDGDAREEEQKYLDAFSDTTLNIHNPKKGAKSKDWK